jgi:hypothetical protein
MRTLLNANWTGNALNESVELDGRRFKLVAVMRNGRTSATASIVSDTGLHFILGDDDLAKSKTRCSYVSDEDLRKTWAIERITTLKNALKKLYK